MNGPAVHHAEMVCDPAGRCITCADEGIAMRVIAVAPDGLARCADPAGEVSEIDLSLVAGAGPGDLVLAHAGVALTALAEEAA